MKKILILSIIAIMALSLSACSNNEPAPSAEKAAPAATAPVAPQTTNAPIAPAAPAAPSGISGKVIETMNSGGYTYVQVDNGTEKIWAAAPEFAVNVGDEVVVPEGMAMHNYHSQTLDRDFPLVYFVESVLNSSNPAVTAPAGDSGQMPAGHPPVSGMQAPEQVDLSHVEKVAGGKTIGEIYAAKSDLSGKEVSLRGKVVKFSPQIMGTNWIHVQDGSGDQASGTNDLTVTSSAEVKMGDTVVIKGVLTLDKDFGYGYKYALIVENASVTVE